MLELSNNLVGSDLGEANVAVAHAHGDNLAAGAKAIRHDGDGVETLAASLRAVDDDALVLVVPDAALPEREHAVAGANDDLLAHVGALCGKARDNGRAEKLLLLVLATDHDSPADVGDGQRAAAGGDPLLAEATGTRLRRRQRGEGRDVVVVGAVRVLWLQRHFSPAPEISDVVDVQRARVGAEDERLGREGMDQRRRIDGAVGAVRC